MSKGTAGMSEEGEGLNEDGSAIFIPKLTMMVRRSIVHGRASALVPRNEQQEQSREDNDSRRRAGSATTIVSGTTTENSVRGGGGRFSTFMRNLSTNSIAGMPTAGRVGTGGHVVFGVARQSPLADAVMRKSRQPSSMEDDGLAQEEIIQVRESYKKMVAAVEAAGGKRALEAARQALLDTAVETSPKLDTRDLTSFLTLRGLDIVEELDPERIRELAVAMFLLSRKKSLTFDSVIRVAYTIFDEDGDGELDKDEFQALMRATLKTHLSLEFVLRLPAGKEAFLGHLKEEYAEENFYFWQSSEQFASSIPTVAKAQTLYDGYIREGAPKQVNISAQTNKGIREKWHAVQNGEAPLTRKLFSSAQTEVFSLMQRDNFERFRQNSTRMEGFIDCMFKEVDRSNNGTISLEEYTEWAHNNRDVMRFMRGTGGKIAVVRQLSEKNRLRGTGVRGAIPTSDSSANTARNQGSMTLKGIRQARSSRVIIVRSDTSSSGSLSPSTSCASSTGCLSKSTTSRGGDSGSDDGCGRGGTRGRRRGNRSGSDGDDASRGGSSGGGDCFGAGDDNKKPLRVPSTASSSSTQDRGTKNQRSSTEIVESSRSGRATGGGRRSRRIACTDGGVGGDDSDPKKYGSGVAEVRAGDSGDSWDKGGGGSTPERTLTRKVGKTAAIVSARRRLRAYFAFHLRSSEGVAARGKRWTSDGWRTDDKPVADDASGSDSAAGSKPRDGATGLRRGISRLCLDFLDNLTAKLAWRKHYRHQLVRAA